MVLIVFGFSLHIIKRVVSEDAPTLLLNVFHEIGFVVAGKQSEPCPLTPVFVQRYESSRELQVFPVNLRLEKPASIHLLWLLIIIVILGTVNAED